MTLFEFTTEKSVLNWYAQNDTVMGGISNSHMRFKEKGLASFSGNVSLENNGGFAQVKYDKTSFDLRSFTGLELRVKGDNKMYQLRLQTDAGRISYAQSFFAASDGSIVKLAFTSFKATFRGRDVANAPALNLAEIRTLSFLLSDKQEGPFELLIDRVKAL